MSRNCLFLIVLILIIWFLYKSKATFDSSPLYLFWHIGALKDRSKRLEEILNRQWNLITNSGLYNALNGIYIGIIGPERPPILIQLMKNPKVHVIEANQTKLSEHECYTSNFLWKFCKQNPNCNVIYIHSRGITHDPNINSDDWTKLMEYFIIENWENNIEYIKVNETLGVDMCEALHNALYHPPHSSYHYPGNFWWAKASYIKKLAEPFSFANSGTNRHKCSENWLFHRLIDLKDHKNLFYTGIEYKYPETGITFYYKNRFHRNTYTSK